MFLVREPEAVAAKVAQSGFGCLLVVTAMLGYPIGAKRGFWNRKAMPIKGCDSLPLELHKTSYTAH